MKKLLLGLFLLCACFIQANAQKDSTITRSTLYGIGSTNILDTYLSPMEYTGPEIRVLRESMRMTNLWDGNISRQTLFQANLSLTENKAGTGSEISFLANWNFAWHYQFRINENLKLMAGPNLDLNGGMIYNMRNSNNPVQAKAYANLGASGMAIWHFKVKKQPFMLRYQLNVPLLGLMFSPEYGEGYYEISETGDWKNNIYFTALHNQPSIRQFLTLDIPIKKTNLRLGYVCDIQQATLNDLKNHTWSHTFMIGFVKHFQLVNPYQ